MNCVSFVILVTFIIFHVNCKNYVEISYESDEELSSYSETETPNGKTCLSEREDYSSDPELDVITDQVANDNSSYQRNVSRISRKTTDKNKTTLIRNLMHASPLLKEQNSHDGIFNQRNSNTENNMTTKLNITHERNAISQRQFNNYLDRIVHTLSRLSPKFKNLNRVEVYQFLKWRRERKDHGAKSNTSSLPQEDTFWIKQVKHHENLENYDETLPKILNMKGIQGNSDLGVIENRIESLENTTRKNFKIRSLKDIQEIIRNDTDIKLFT